MALLKWDVEVNGAKAAEDAVASLDEQFAGLAGSAGSADDALAGFTPAADSAAKGAKGAADGMNGARSASEGLEQAIGSVNKAVGVFGAVGLIGAVSGLIDLAVKTWEATDAGMAHKAQVEATAGAIDAMVAKLKEQADAANVATDATWNMINAQVAQELASKGLTSTTAEIIDKQRQFGEAVRDLGIIQAEASRMSQMGPIELEAYSQRADTARNRVATLQGDLVALNATWEEQRSALASATGLLNSATEAIDLQGGKVLPTATQQVSALAVAWGALTSALETGVAVFADTVPDLIGGTPILDAALIGAEDVVGTAVSALDRLRGAIFATADARDEAARRAQTAAALEAAAYAGAASAALGSVAQIAEAFGASAAVVAGIKIAENIAAAAEETAKAIAAAASLNIPGAIAHGAAAAAHVAAAVKWGADALGGGGGGSVPSASAAQPTPPADRSSAIDAGNRDRGGDGGTVVNMNFAGQPLNTRSDIQDGVTEALDAASRRRGRGRANLAALQSRGRRR